MGTRTPKVLLAKVAAWQAIAVALITGAAGVAVAYVNSGGGKDGMPLVRAVDDSATAEQLRELLLANSGEFQWQWAGENWIGYFRFYEENDRLLARLTMNKVRYRPDNLQREQLPKMRTVDPGFVTFDGYAIEISALRLENWEYADWDPQRVTDHHFSTVRIRLEQRVGFTGGVFFRKDGDPEEYPGGIEIIEGRWIP